MTNRVVGINASGGFATTATVGANKVEHIGKLKSLAQSIAVSSVTQNPYSLNADIYSTQTSTAIVNDHALTSSSSSSGNNNIRNNNIHSKRHRHFEQRQNSTNSDQLHHNQMGLTTKLQQQYGTAAGMTCSAAGQLVAVNDQAIRNKKLLMRSRHAHIKAQSKQI